MDQNHVQQLYDALLATCFRSDAVTSEFNLQISAFTALGTLVDKVSVQGADQIIMNQLPKLLDILQKNVNPEVQNLTLAVLQSVSMRLSQGQLNEEISDVFVNLILAIFKQRQVVVEEGLYALAGLAICIGKQFNKYMQEVGPFVLYAMKQIDQNTVCKCGMTVVGDLARALERDMAPYAPQFIPILEQALQSHEINRYTKLIVINSIGDMAMAIKSDFVPFLHNMLGTLQAACQTATSNVQGDSDLKEYFSELKESLVECYTGIVNGMKDEQQEEKIFGNIPLIVQYLINFAQEEQSQNFYKICCGLIGDIGITYKVKVKQYLAINEVWNIIQKLRAFNDKESQDLADWCQRTIQSL